MIEIIRPFIYFARRIKKGEERGIVIMRSNFKKTHDSFSGGGSRNTIRKVIFTAQLQLQDCPAKGTGVAAEKILILKIIPFPFNLP